MNKWSLTFNKNPIVKPTANFSFTANLLDVSFKNESSDTTVNFKWFFGDGDSSTMVSPMHSYLDSGMYTVKLFASNTAGKDSIIKEIHVEKNGTPDGIKNNFKNEFTVFPNPFSKNLMVKIEVPSNGILELRNALGQLVAERNITSSEKETQLNTENFPKGIYTIYFKTEKGISLAKVIK